MRKIDLSLVEQYTMPSGIGNLAENKICLVAQANLIDCLEKGLPIEALSDSLECACPVLRVLAICLNDTKWWINNQERTETLRPLISLLLDSNRDSNITAQRGQKAADFAKYAAQYAAQYAAEYEESAAKYATKYAAEYAAESLRPLRDELLKIWMECEALQ